VIELRDFILQDAASIVENGNSENMSRFLREVFPFPYTLDAATWWVTEGYKLGDSRNSAIVLHGECIGGAGLQFQENEHRYSCQLGYWLGERHWGKGIATNVLAQLKKIAFTEYDIRRLYAPVASDNVASARVLEKNGIVLEGILESHLYLRGKLYDEHIYATFS